MKNLLLIPIALFVFASCQSEQDKKAEKARHDSLQKAEAREKYYLAARKADSALFADKKYDPKKANEALRAYSDFFTMYPDDSLAPEYLFRAGQLAEGSGNYPQAAVYYETIIEKHKGYKQYPEAVFAAANVYDQYLENVNHGDERAKQLYNFIIQNYPDTKLAEDCQVLVKYVGVPDSVMYNDIMKKAEQDRKK